ncbi:MAG: hypothetical protein GY867_10955 [bacterium]|nr:hypothetical protein [bacterium]
MIRVFLTVAVILGALAGCGEEELPSRDEIPILRQRVFALEQAIASGDPLILDSLLSVEILDEGLSSDSLLGFVFGPDNDFPFHRLGDCEIFYTKEVAVVDCHVMDSTETADRPIKLHFKKFDEIWLLRKFEGGETTPASGS